jgi:hypothetical protein
MTKDLNIFFFYDCSEARRKQHLCDKVLLKSFIFQPGCLNNFATLFALERAVGRQLRCSVRSKYHLFSLPHQLTKNIYINDFSCRQGPQLWALTRQTCHVNFRIVWDPASGVVGLVTYNHSCYKN